MAYTITYDKDKGGVVTTYSGVVTDEDIINSVKERTTSDSLVKSFKYAISDYTKCKRI